MESHIQESVVEIAINETGFGKFNIKVSILCYLIYLNTALCTTATGFFLPAASCDLKMNTFDKGQFSSVYLAGTCISSIVCGFLTDLKGRRWILIMSLFVQGISDLFQAFIRNYWAAIFLKFISGMASTGQMFTLFIYMSECIPAKQRKSLMSFMEIAWILGQALAARLAIIPLNIEYRMKFFVFRSWNLYILLNSLPSILIGFWLFYFPETPKYLAEMDTSEKLLEVLVDIYEENSGKPGKQYIEKLMNSGNSSVIEMIDKSRNKLLIKQVNPSTKTMISNELKRLKCILTPPYLKNTFFSCTTSFFIISSYYALYLWLPEIFQRFADFDAQNENGSTKFCAVAEKVLSPNVSQEDPFDCNRRLDTSIFINNLWLCAACIPSVFPITFLVNRLGFKFFLVSHTMICSIVIIGIYFVNTTLENLILLCIYWSLLTVGTTSSYAFFVTIFPTNLRSSGVTLTSFFSRMGGVFGNFIFSYLIDNYCFTLIIIVAAKLLMTTLSTLLIRVS